MEERVDKVWHEKSVCCGVPVVTGVHRLWCKYHPRNQKCSNCLLLEGDIGRLRAAATAKISDLRKAYEAKIRALRKKNRKLTKLTEDRDKLAAFILNLAQVQEEEEEGHVRK